MTRIISVSDEAYEVLSRRKGNESFTKTIIKLCEQNPQKLSSFAGNWKDEKDIEDIFLKIQKNRSKKDTRKGASW